MFFVGTGYAAEEMKQLVHDKGLDDKVTFTGMLTEREQITRYYAAADLFLFPSLYDNAPLVVREAAALHTPSVMVEGSTAATILRDGENGFLVKDSLDDFETRLRSLYADRPMVRRVGVAASHSIVRSWEDVVGEVLDRYNHIIARKSQIRPLK
jgi:glycosyltransferase involved in cell wall biosynthesis